MGTEGEGVVVCATAECVSIKYSSGMAILPMTTFIALRVLGGVQPQREGASDQISHRLKSKGPGIQGWTLLGLQYRGERERSLSHSTGRRYATGRDP